MMPLECSHHFIKFSNITARDNIKNIKNLKKALKTLKSSNSNHAEIKYVSHLRNKYQYVYTVNKTTNNAEALNHDNYIELNFWGYVKCMFDKKDIVLPTFTMRECLSYFKNVLAKVPK